MEVDVYIQQSTVTSFDPPPPPPPSTELLRDQGLIAGARIVKACLDATLSWVLLLLLLLSACALSLVGVGGVVTPPARRHSG